VHLRHSPLFFFHAYAAHTHLHSFPTRRSSDLLSRDLPGQTDQRSVDEAICYLAWARSACMSLGVQALAQAAVLTLAQAAGRRRRSEEHTSELQSLAYLVCRLLLEKKKKNVKRM